MSGPNGTGSGANTRIPGDLELLGSDTVPEHGSPGGIVTRTLGYARLDEMTQRYANDILGPVHRTL